MGNPSPIQVPSDLSNIETISDVVRYFSAAVGQITSQFNSLLANKDIYGSVSATGFVGFTGSGNFGVSFVSAGVYFVSFRQPYSFPPSVVIAPQTTNATMIVFGVSGVTTSGFSVNMNTSGGSAVNNPFHFHAKGAR